MSEYKNIQLNKTYTMLSEQKKGGKKYVYAW